MKMRFLLLAIAAAAVLVCGCESYRYTFDTVISADGTVERTVHFWSVEREVRKPAAQGQPAEVTTENPGLPATLVIPDRERFEEFKLTDNDFKGRWHSDGRIYSDFRQMTSSFVHGVPVEGKPRMPSFIREAHNDGQVTVTDLVLVKAISYTETFHDYYTREELEAHGDAVIDILAGLFLDVLHADFGDEYDFKAFDALMLDKVVPIVKKWKLDLMKKAPEKSDGAEITLSSFFMPSAKLGFVCELLRLGAMNRIELDETKIMDYLLDWAIERMHELVKRKADGAPWPKRDIEAYFGRGSDKREQSDYESSAFMKCARALVAERYGAIPGSESFGLHLAYLFNSLAFTPDSHDFEVTVWAPGPIVHASPKPVSVEPQPDGTVVVAWGFKKDAFFPDGVELSLVCAVPVADAQVRLFGKTVLDRPEQLRRFVSLLLRLPDEERAAFLTCLRECTEKLSLKGLARFAKGRAPKGGVSGARVELMIEELVGLLEDAGRPAH
jgi:hypothetical protein